MQQFKAYFKFGCASMLATARSHNVKRQVSLHRTIIKGPVSFYFQGGKQDCSQDYNIY